MEVLGEDQLLVRGRVVDHRLEPHAHPVAVLPLVPGVAEAHGALVTVRVRAVGVQGERLLRRAAPLGESAELAEEPVAVQRARLAGGFGPGLARAGDARGVAVRAAADVVDGLRVEEGDPRGLRGVGAPPALVLGVGSLDEPEIVQRERLEVVLDASEVEVQEVAQSVAPPLRDEALRHAEGVRIERLERDAHELRLLRRTLVPDAAAERVERLEERRTGQAIEPLGEERGGHRLGEAVLRERRPGVGLALDLGVVELLPVEHVAAAVGDAHEGALGVERQPREAGEEVAPVLPEARRVRVADLAEEALEVLVVVVARELRRLPDAAFPRAAEAALLGAYVVVSSLCGGHSGSLSDRSGSRVGDGRGAAGQPTKSSAPVGGRFVRARFRPGVRGVSRRLVGADPGGVGERGTGSRARRAASSGSR